MSNIQHTRQPSSLSLPSTPIKAEKNHDYTASTRVPPARIVSSIWNHPLFPQVLAAINNLNPTQPSSIELTPEEIIAGLPSQRPNRIKTDEQQQQPQTQTPQSSQPLHQQQPMTDEYHHPNHDEKNDDEDGTNTAMGRIKQQQSDLNQPGPSSYTLPIAQQHTPSTAATPGGVLSSLAAPQSIDHIGADPILQQHIDDLLRKYLLYLHHEEQELRHVANDLENTTSLSQLLLAQAQVDISPSTISTLSQHQPPQPHLQELYKTINDASIGQPCGHLDANSTTTTPHIKKEPLQDQEHHTGR